LSGFEQSGVVRSRLHIQPQLPGEVLSRCRLSVDCGGETLADHSHYSVRLRVGRETCRCVRLLSLYGAPPDPLASLRGPTSKGEGRAERERTRGEKGDGGTAPFINSWIRPCYAWLLLVFCTLYTYHLRLLVSCGSTVNTYLLTFAHAAGQCHDYLEVSSSQSTVTYFSECGATGKQIILVQSSTADINFVAAETSSTQRGFFIHYEGATTDINATPDTILAVFHLSKPV